MTVPKGLNHLPDDLLQQAIEALTMSIDIDIEPLFPEGLSDEAISAINDVLAEIAMQWESKHYHQLKRFREQQQIAFCDPLKPWCRKNLV